MNFIQFDMVQPGWTQNKIIDIPIAGSFRIFQMFDSSKEYSILEEWFSDYRLPSFNASSLRLADTDESLLSQIKSKGRDLNIVQTSSLIQKQSQWEADRQRAIMAAFKFEIMRALDQTLRVVRTYTVYKRTILTILTETGRIFLAGELSLKQFMVETKAKDELWNLEATKYGSVVMASVIPGRKWLVRNPIRSQGQKIMGVASYGVTGAYIGGMIWGGIGAVVGFVIGVIVGWAIEF